MSKFTKESPFEFEGVKVWRDEWRGSIVTSTGLVIDDTSTSRRAVEAILEAERNEWHWTNDDKTEARKGRWVVDVDPNSVHVGHDDLPGLSWTCYEDQGLWDHGTPRDIKEVGGGFLAWHAAQQQPEEPTGLGAVVEVAGMRFTHVPKWDKDPLPWTRFGSDGKAFYDWEEVVSLGPVTVLSTGVES